MVSLLFQGFLLADFGDFNFDLAFDFVVQLRLVAQLEQDLKVDEEGCQDDR